MESTVESDEEIQVRKRRPPSHWDNYIPSHHGKSVCNEKSNKNQSVPRVTTTNNKNAKDQQSQDLPLPKTIPLSRNRNGYPSQCQSLFSTQPCFNLLPYRGHLNSIQVLHPAVKENRNQVKRLKRISYYI